MEPVSTRGVSDPELVERPRRGDHAPVRRLSTGTDGGVSGPRSPRSHPGRRRGGGAGGVRGSLPPPGDFREDAQLQDVLLSIAGARRSRARRNVRSMLRRFVQPPRTPSGRARWGPPRSNRRLTGSCKGASGARLRGSAEAPRRAAARRRRRAQLTATSRHAGIPSARSSGGERGAEAGSKEEARGMGTVMADTRRDSGLGIRIRGKRGRERDLEALIDAVARR